MEKVKQIYKKLRQNKKYLQIVGLLLWGILVIIINALAMKNIAANNVVDMKKLIFFNVAILVAAGAGSYLLKRYRQKWMTMALLLITPAICFFMVENITGYWGGIEIKYKILNLLFYFVIELFMLLFFKNSKTVFRIMYSVFPLLAMVGYYVNKLRGRPFFLQDIRSFKTATTVMGSYSYDIGVRVAAMLLGAATLLFLTGYLAEIKWEKGSKIRKAVAVAATIVLGMFFTNADMIGKLECFKLTMWDIQQNYQTKGYLCTLAAEIQYLKPTEPDGYSAAEAQKIQERYTKAYMESAESNEAAGVQEKVIPDNIILIMNESWADLRYINDFQQADTITPYIDSLEENVIKGYVQVPVFGAGTANSEYEVLVGNSMQFLNANDIAYELYVTEKEEGMASLLKEQGYHTIAIHPAPHTNWNRNRVYPYMQFDEFYAEHNWRFAEPEKIRWYTTDKSSYDVLRTLQEEKAEGDKNFCFLVTMQNHGGYDTEGFEATVDFDYEEEYPLTEQYLSLLKITDKAFEGLVNYYKDVEENTMIIMFGDHLPNIETSFYEKLAGTSWDQMSVEDKQKIYTTPFIIWTNYDIEEENGLKMSTNYFGSYVLEKAGMQLSDYQKCLLKFREELPIMGTGMVMDAEGNWYDLEAMPEKCQQVYNDYQILQYDNMMGK